MTPIPQRVSVFTLFLRRAPIFDPRFYAPAFRLQSSKRLECVMDLVFIVLALGLWGLLALLVRGFEKLQAPGGRQS
jgi:hypothetical protein